MYRQLLDDLIRQHSSLDLKNRFQILPYKNGNPVIIINNNIFGIKSFEYSINPQLYQDKLEDFRKIPLDEKQPTIYPDKRCNFCFDIITEGIVIEKEISEYEFIRNICCIDCYNYCEYGTVNSKYPILSDYNLMNKGFMILENTNFFANKNKLIIAYNYHNYHISLHIRLLDKLTNCPNNVAVKYIGNLNTPIYDFNEQMKNIPDYEKCNIIIRNLDDHINCCLCGNDCNLDRKSNKLTVCMACPYILLTRFVLLYVPSFIFINYFNQLNEDVITTIKEIFLQIIIGE